MTTVKQIFSILKIFVKKENINEVVFKWEDSSCGIRKVEITETGTEVIVKITE